MNSKALIPLLLLGGAAAAAAGASGARRRRRGSTEIVFDDGDTITGGGGGGGEDERDPYFPDEDIGESTVPPPVSEPILYRIEEGEAALARREANTGKRISRGLRDMGPVDGLVLHQMSFSRGNDPSRYYGVTAHFIILPNGQIVQLHGEDEYLNASDEFNRYTVSVEFAGNLPSANGNYFKPEDFGRDLLTTEQIAAGRYLVDYLIDRLPQLGSPGLSYIYAHRQSSGSRGNDPGPDIWYNVAEWAIRNRGLSDSPTGDPDFIVGDGKSIPDSWRGPSSNAIA